MKKNLSSKTFKISIILENCGIDTVSRGIALGFERVAKGSDAKIINVSTKYIGRYLFS